MSNDKQDELLQKLEKFESSSKITNKSLSMASLAGLLGTNTQYLSELINTHKGKNFNAYINELRINYISRKILENKEYNNYKIAYLADEAGFSSHSVFTKVFKKQNGISPSKFIALNAKEKKENL